MNNWKDIVVRPELPLRDAIARIDSTGHQLTVVLEEDGRLAGVLSDGDVRRAILRGVDLAVPTASVMNRAPTTAAASASTTELLALMRRKVLRHLPLLDEHGRVCGVATFESLMVDLERPNRVVLMAGGLGSRLLPLTESCPKPLLRVGGKPILEVIVENLATQGFRHFYLAVNYMAQAFKDHFGNGERWGVAIAYLEEEKPLGTAGALSLLPEVPADPVIVMNGDLLTHMRFDAFLDFHETHGVAATMAVRDHEFQVPYGVASVDGHRLVGLEEKPVHRFFVNAGIYALSAAALRAIPRETSLDMPALFERLRQQGHETGAYPLREYWLDIGRMEEFERAQHEWRQPGQRHAQE